MLYHKIIPYRMMSGAKVPDFDAYGLWDYHPTFMLISGRVPRSFAHI